MRRIRVLVALHVDECGPDAKIDLETMQDAAVDAVENAMRHAEDNGFCTPIRRRSFHRLCRCRAV